MLIKDPDAFLDYGRNWASWLGDDTIVASDWIVPDGITEETASFTTTTTTIWLSGGTVGETYDLTNRITTADGRIDDRTFSIKIRER